MRMNDTDLKNFDDELMAAAAELTTEVAPGRDLWPGIEQAISMPAKPGRTMWNSVWAQAAAVLLLVGGSSGVTYLAMTENMNPDLPVLPVANSPSPVLRFEPVSASFGGLYHLGPDYQDARRGLSATVDDELSRLTPEERDEVRKNIDVIRKAIDDINTALVREPDNALLQKLLISTYREELDLMMRVNGITSAAMRRGDI
jgi:hypothetical protein